MRIRLPRNRKISIGLLLLVAIIVLIATADTLVTTVDKMFPSPALSWPTTDGTILYVDIDCNESSDREGYITGYWNFTIGFTYELDGMLHRGVQQVSWGDVKDVASLTEQERYYMFGDCSGKREEPQIVRSVEEKLNFQVGRPVIVYYDPEDIDEAVIAPGAGPTIGFWMLLGLEFGLIGALLYVLTR